MTARKKKLLKFSFGLMVVLIVCTMLAQTIHTVLLPVVDTIKPVSAIVEDGITVKGTVQKNSSSVSQKTTSQSWNVQEVYVTCGDTVKKGDKLFKIDTAELEAKRKMLWADIQEQKNYINAYDWTGGDRLVLTEKLESAEDEYSIFLESYPSSGVIYAETDGEITWSLLDEQNQIPEYTKYIEISDEKTSDHQITWTLTNLAGQKYCEAESVTITLKFYNQDEIQVDVIPEYEKDGDQWNFFANFEEDIDFDRVTDVSVKMVKSSNTYDAVVPRSCVQEDISGENYVFVINRETGVFEDQLTVQKQTVQVLDENELYVAISLPNAQSLSHLAVVKSSSRPISEGDIVCLKE